MLSKVPYFTYFWIWLDKGEVHQCVDASIEFSRNQFNSESSKEEYLKMKEYEIEILKKSLPAYSVDEIREEFIGNVKFTDDKAKAIREQFEFVIKCVDESVARLKTSDKKPSKALPFISRFILVDSVLMDFKITS